MKKLLCTMTAVMMTAAMVTGCGSSADQKADAAPATTAAAEAATEAATEAAEAAAETESAAVSAEQVNIGVIQYMQHGSLDEAYQGFVDGLAEAGYKVQLINVNKKLKKY